MKNLNLSLISLLLFVAFATSCSKDSNSSNPVVKDSTVNNSLPSSVLQSTPKYSGKSGSASQTFYTYDGSGRLTLMTTYKVDSSNLGRADTTTTTYSYLRSSVLPSSSLVTEVYYLNAGTYQQSNFYKYSHTFTNTGNDLTTDYIIGYDSANKVTDSTRVDYTYTTNLKVARYKDLSDTTYNYYSLDSTIYNNNQNVIRTSNSYVYPQNPSSNYSYYINYTPSNYANPLYNIKALSSTSTNIGKMFQLNDSFTTSYGTTYSNSYVYYLDGNYRVNKIVDTIKGGTPTYISNTIINY